MRTHETADGSRELLGIVSDGRKLIISPDKNSVEYYELDSDPTEQNNLAESKPSEAAKMRALLDELEASLSVHEREFGGMDLSPEFERLIKELGYAGDDDS